MSEYVFLYKENSNDRDCVAYIKNKPMRFECGHYFGSVGLHGSCYSGSKFADYEDIKTILTKEEYEALIDFSKTLNELGFGIKNGDERYNKGVELCNNIQYVYDKLLSEENAELFEEVWEEEKEYLMEEYNLDEDDIECIFDRYSLNYKDRSVVGAIYDDVEELGYEEAFSCGYVDTHNNSIVERYFDFEKFGEDLLEEEQYCLLADGRVAYLNY